MAKCFLTKMTAQTKISVLSTPKLARDKRFKILLMVRSKKHKTTRPLKSGLNWFSRYLAKEKESRNIEAITACELDTHLASSWQFANKMAASRQTFLRCKEALLQRYLGEQKSQRNILKDNEFKQCRRSCLMAKSAEHQQLQDPWHQYNKSVPCFKRF